MPFYTAMQRGFVSLFCITVFDYGNGEGNLRDSAPKRRREIMTEEIFESMNSLLFGVWFLIGAALVF